MSESTALGAPGLSDGAGATPLATAPCARAGDTFEGSQIASSATAYLAPGSTAVLTNEYHNREVMPDIIKMGLDHPDWTYSKIGKELDVSEVYVRNVLYYHMIPRKRLLKKEKIIEIAESNPTATYMQIARMTDCTEHYVRMVMSYSELSGPHRQHPHFSRRLTTAAEEQAVQMLKDGELYRVIARKFGISSPAVVKIAQRNGVPMRRRGRRTRRPKNVEV
jgi:DNA-binding CsgD family transcriptional regulator